MAFSDGITSLIDLRKHIADNEKCFYTIAPQIIEALNNLVYEFDEDFIAAVYMSAHISYVNESTSKGKEGIHERLRLVLRAYTSKLTYIGSPSETNYMDVVAFLATDMNLLDNIEVSSDTYKKLYRVIIDTRIVSDCAYELLELACDVNLYHNPDPETNTEIQKYRATVEDWGSIVLLCRHVKEIATNEDLRWDLCKQVGKYMNTEIKSRNILYEIVSRFGASVENAEDIITEIIYAFRFQDPFDYQFIYAFDKLRAKLVDECNLEDQTPVNPKIFSILCQTVAEKLVPYSGVDPLVYAHNYRILRNTIMANNFKVPDLEKRRDQFIAKENLKVKIKYGENYTVDPETFLPIENTSTDAATEASHKLSGAMNAAQHKIYGAFKKFKDGEDQVDNQLTKLVKAMKKMVTGDTRAEVIEGKKFSVLGIFKKVLATAAIFSYSKVGLICVLLVRYTLRKNTMKSERRKIMQEIEVELQLIDEKIDDARGDQNRKAKYALMRTRAELQKTLEKIKYGMETDDKMTASAHKVLDDARNS